MPTSTALDRASLSVSGTQASESKAMRDAVQRSTEALALILVTHEHVMQCFSSSEGGSDPLLIRLLRLLQQSTTNPAESPNTTLSMIQVQATSSRSSTETLQPILATLPNAHLFLRYLPEQIITFTPYIDIDSADSELKSEALKQKLDTWFLEAIKTFENGISKLFEALGDARQLAEVKTTIRDYLQQRPSTAGINLSERLAELLATLEVALGQRFVEIYTRKIDNIAKIVPEALEGALRALPSSQEDLHPVDFIFSTSLPFPSSSIFPTNASATSVGKRASLDPFTIFKKAMLDRVSGRSPVLLSCLQQLEFASGEMQADMVAWLREMPDESAKEAYTATARKGLNKIEDVLRDLLDKQAGIPEQLFIGSVAVHLALDSTFVQSLLLLPGTDSKLKS